VRRAFLIVILSLVFVMVVLPALIVKGCRYSDTAPVPSDESSGLDIRILVSTTGEVVTLPLEEYVAGVVAAEMPTSFDIEALKAQAVIARTFAVRRSRLLGGQGVPGHPEADVTTDIWAGGQNWMPKARAREEWGFFGFYGRWAKIEEAVEATRGLVVTYNGVPIEPAYHSTCGGFTEDSENVWQEAVPYLRAVPCTWCSHSPWMEATTEVSIPAMEQAFGLETGLLAAAAGQDRPYIEVVEKSESGRAVTVRVGEKEIRGLEFRRALGLKSTRFTYTVSGGTLEFVTVGYGHGVGLCQYGADGLARAGRTFREILAYYYTGTEVESFDFGGR